MAKKSGIYPLVAQGDPRWASWFGILWVPRIAGKLRFRLQNMYWPRFRIEIDTTDGRGAEAALERLAGRRGGVRLTVETLDLATEKGFPEAAKDLSKALGYEDEPSWPERMPFEDEEATKERVPRIDASLGAVILEAVRIATISRTAPSREERLAAREHLRRASLALGVFWPGTLREGEVLAPERCYVDELAWLVKASRQIYRRELGRTMDEAQATARARKEWWPQIHLLFFRWELKGNEVDWKKLKREHTWRQIFSRPQENPGVSVPRTIATELLGLSRERE